MDNSSIYRDQGKSINGASLKDSSKRNVDSQSHPEERNGTSAGCRLTEEMLEYYYKESKEYERYKLEYEEAAYRVYGTIPTGVDPQTFRARMEQLPKKGSSKVWGQEIVPLEFSDIWWETAYYRTWNGPNIEYRLEYILQNRDLYLCKI